MLNMIMKWYVESNNDFENGMYRPQYECTIMCMIGHINMKQFISPLYEMVCTVQNVNINWYA